MPPVRSLQIEAYVFRRLRGRLEFLLLKRSPERSLAGVWQPVTGGIESGESAWRAAAREVLEETGLVPLRWWALEATTSFYDPARDAVQVLPVFAAEAAWTDAVHLSHEHDRYAFLAPAAAAKRVLWASQRRSLAAIRAEIVAGGPGADAREITARIAGAPRAGARRARRPPIRKARTAREES